MGPRVASDLGRLGPANSSKTLTEQAVATVSAVPAALAVFNDPNLPPQEGWRLLEERLHRRAGGRRDFESVRVGARAGSMFCDGLRAQHWDYVNAPPPRTESRSPRRFSAFYVSDAVSAADFLLNHYKMRTEP